MLLLVGLVMWMADGAPFLAACVLSPIAVWSLVQAGGVVTFLWFTLLLVRVGLVGQEVGAWARGTVTAVLAGLTPHAFVLMLLNSRFSRPWHTLDGVERLGAWAIGYETLALSLHEGWNALLMPTPTQGAVVAGAVLALAILVRRLSLGRYWSLIADSARWVGISLIAATAFTVATTAPEGRWRPDKEVVVRERVAMAATALAKLNLYRRANAELEQAPSLWRQALVTAAAGRPNNPSRFSFSEPDLHPYEIAEEVARWSGFSRDLASSSFFYEAIAKAQSRGTGTSVKTSRKEAELLRQNILIAEAHVAEERKQFQELVAGTIAGVASEMARSYAGDLASAFIEDAAKTLALNILHRSPSAREMVGWISSGLLPHADFAGWLSGQLAAVKAAMARPAVVAQIQRGLEARLEAARASREAAMRADFKRQVEQRARRGR